MKKSIKSVFALLFSVLMVVSLFAVGTLNAEEVQVSVGSKFEYNVRDVNENYLWVKTPGSPDGMWLYQLYGLNTKKYQTLVYSSSKECFAWMKEPGDVGVGYARVRMRGENFHPSSDADVVKTFVCPSGGKIQFKTTVARANEWNQEIHVSPTSFAIYVEDRLVYPTNGEEYEVITSTEPTDIVIDLEVKKNERVYVHIGAMGQHDGDAVNMSNTVIYKSVNDEVFTPQEENTSTDNSSTNSLYNPPIVPQTNKNPGGNNNNGGNQSQTPAKNNFPVVPVVIGGVAVVAVAVVVVFVLRKKKQG